MTAPDPHGLTRRALRTASRRAGERAEAARARHARRGGIRMRAVAAIAGALVIVCGTVAAVGAAIAAPALNDPATGTAQHVDSVDVRVQSMPAEGLPTPLMSADAASAGTVCEEPALSRALAAGDDAAAVAALGGAEGFRTTVAASLAPCLSLDDPSRTWMVVNKLRPYAPMDWAPPELVASEGVRSLEQSTLRPEAAAALTALVRAAAAAGAGEIALESAYRSYATQQQTYRGHVADRGAAGADLVSARPGFSEHQSGLTVDVVPCEGTCASIDDLADSPQGAWLAEHAWEHGWIVRYAAGRTDVTGYAPEPWHLRYIGVELARGYHEGGWSTLEEFFGLPPAPGYAN